MITRKGGDMVEKREAIFSDCLKYRYLLKIVWDESLPLCQFIGLNPSTADEMKDDPTLRRVKAFARSWGHGGVIMTNLFAYRDTSPAAMKKQPEPVGEHNDHYLKLTADRCSRIVCAWGNHGTHMDRWLEVSTLLSNRLMECFRLTGQKQPEHPLYMPSDVKLIWFYPTRPQPCTP